MAFFWRRTAAVTAELHARRCLTSSFQLRLLATTAADPLPSAASTSTSAPPPPRRLGSETLGKLAAANEQAQAETAPATGELEQSPFSPLPKGTPSLRRAPKARGADVPHLYSVTRLTAFGTQAENPSISCGSSGVHHW